MIRAYANFYSGITAHLRSLEQTADNLANVNTPAFKRAEVSFNDLLYYRLQEKRMPTAAAPETPPPQGGSGARAAELVPFFEQGSIVEGGRPFDLASDGQGFFRVFRQDGTAAYTRHGSFYLDRAGRLVTGQGDILDLPFSLAGYRGETVEIAPTGVVTAQNEAGETVTLGVIPLYRFVNTAGLQKTRSGQFLPTEASGEPLAGTPGLNGFGSLRQYCLEGSNVDLGLEMIQLIMAQRALQANARGMTAADELQALTLQVRA